MSTFLLGSRILSIQSHVTYGYVGGKAAVFPLQLLGYDVDAVNTVNFSNHSGYGIFGGSKASAQDLATTFDTMEANGLLTQDRLLTGYIPSAEALSVIAELVKKLKRRTPDLVYLLDPVLGDSGRLYVSPDVIPIYRELLPRATIITPNWFEVETLTNVPLKDMPSLRLALSILHQEYRVPHVVLSSIPLHDFLRDALPTSLCQASGTSSLTSSSQLICISSSHCLPQGASEGVVDDMQLSKVHAHVLPCIQGYFSGVGDLFSALLLAHFHCIKKQEASTTWSSISSSPMTHAMAEIFHNDASHSSLSIATSLALSKTFGLLKLTHEQVSSSPSVMEDATDDERDESNPERRVRRMRTRELRLVQGQHIIRSAPSPRSGSSPEDEEAVELREMRPWDGFWTSYSS